MMIIVFIAIGALVYFAFNANTNRTTSSSNTNYPNFNRTSNANHALDILNERFAKGEIEESEYLKKKATLNQ